MNPSDPTPAKPPFTRPSRILSLIALVITAGVMYWVLTNDSLDGTKKLLAAGGALMAGLLVIAGGAHFTEGKHRK